MMEKRNVATRRREVIDDADIDVDAAVSLFSGSKTASAKTSPDRDAVAEDERNDEDTLSGRE